MKIQSIEESRIRLLVYEIPEYYWWTIFSEKDFVEIDLCTYTWIRTHFTDCIRTHGLTLGFIYCTLLHIRARSLLFTVEAVRVPHEPVSSFAAIFLKEGLALAGFSQPPSCVYQHAEGAYDAVLEYVTRREEDERTLGERKRHRGGTRGEETRATMNQGKQEKKARQWNRDD